MAETRNDVPSRGIGSASIRYQYGFTLIEVLVVVAIIALLVSILLPTLSQAREQAKRVTCLAHMKMIGTGAATYILSEKNRFPYSAWSNSKKVLYGKTWSYGGTRGDGSLSDWGGWDLLPEERPLNRYVYNTNKFGKVSKLDVYICPSDFGVRLNSEPTSTVSAKPGYQALGTSYQANKSWGYYADASEGPGGEGYSGAALTTRLAYLQDNIIRIMLRKSPSRFIVLYEDPADWALNTADKFPAGYKVSAWHQKPNWHCMIFLDGHADYLFIDFKKNSRLIQNRSGTSLWLARQDYREQ